MDMWAQWLPWVVGIAIASALLGGASGRRRRRRKPRRRAEGRRFPREAVAGRIVRITDGDGLVADVDGFGRLKIRLAYVDVPEHDQPWGTEAKEALTRFAGAGRCRLRLLARDRYARAVAEMSAGEVVLNEELVRRGYAWTYPRYLSAHRCRRYTALEDEARQAGVGLWGADTSPVSPWEW